MQLKELRQAKELTQTQLAELMGVDQSAVAKWEQGSRFPSGRKLLKLSGILGCTIDLLLAEAHTDEAAS